MKLHHDPEFPEVSISRDISIPLSQFFREPCMEIIQQEVNEIASWHQISKSTDFQRYINSSSTIFQRALYENYSAGGKLNCIMTPDFQVWISREISIPLSLFFREPGMKIIQQEVK